MSINSSRYGGKRGRKPEFDWHYLQKPGDSFFVTGKTAPQMTPNAAKHARKLGEGAAIHCFTFEEGCWIFFAGYRTKNLQDNSVMTTIPKAPGDAQSMPQMSRNASVEDTQDQMDIRQYLVDDEDED